MKEINRISTDDQLVLVTNGDFIHEFVGEFARDQQLVNPLKPLVKGEVMLCEVSDSEVEIQYF